MKAWVSSNFGKFAIELRPLINVRIEFLLNVLKTNIPIKTKFCIRIIIDKIYDSLIDVRIWFLLNILRTNRQIEAKFCIHIIIDKINIRIVNICFSQICNRVTALDCCQKFFF